MALSLPNGWHVPSGQGGVARGAGGQGQRALQAMPDTPRPAGTVDMAVEIAGREKGNLLPALHNLSGGSGGTGLRPCWKGALGHPCRLRICTISNLKWTGLRTGVS